MAELTLESLAERVAALERVVGMPGPERMMKPHVYRVGTGDWEGAMRAAKELSKTYYFDAVREQEEVDFRHARERMNDPG